MREVLRTLESDGLVQRVHGVGTFVTRTETAVTSRFDLDLGVTEAVVAASRRLDIQILRIADDHAAPTWPSGWRSPSARPCWPSSG
jgi:DNA-binding GntR family transcriptional regulator